MSGKRTSKGYQDEGRKLGRLYHPIRGPDLRGRYRRDNPLCLRKFTDGLPHDLYKDCMRLDHPGTYEQWKASTIRRQGEYIHFKNRKEQVKGVPPCPYNPFTPRQSTQTTHCDPDTMDVDRGRARLADAEDILYNNAYKRGIERRS